MLLRTSDLANVGLGQIQAVDSDLVARLKAANTTNTTTSAMKQPQDGTASVIGGIFGGLINAAATVGSSLIQADATRSAAKTQARAANALTLPPLPATTAAAPVAAPVGLTISANQALAIGAVGLLGVGLLALALRRPSYPPQYYPPYYQPQPPPPYGPR